MGGPVRGARIEGQGGQSVYIDVALLRVTLRAGLDRAVGRAGSGRGGEAGGDDQLLAGCGARGCFAPVSPKGWAGGCGPAEPILHSTKPLDPGARGFVRPDGIWGWAAWYLLDRIPADFEQTIQRVPYYRAARVRQGVR